MKAIFILCHLPRKQSYAFQSHEIKSIDYPVWDKHMLWLLHESPEFYSNNVWFFSIWFKDYTNWVEW